MCNRVGWKTKKYENHFRTLCWTISRVGLVAMPKLRPLASHTFLLVASKVYVVSYNSKIWKLEAVFNFSCFQSTEITLCPICCQYGPKKSTSKVWDPATSCEAVRGLVKFATQSTEILRPPKTEVRRCMASNFASRQIGSKWIRFSSKKLFVCIRRMRSRRRPPISRFHFFCTT